MPGQEKGAPVKNALWGHFYSLPKWIYTVPYGNRFYLFKMPVLDYMRYLPFGLECVALAGFLTANHPIKNNPLSDKE